MKTSNTVKFGRLLIASLFILVVIINFENALIFHVNASNFEWKMFLWVIGLLFFVLNLATAFGLLIAKRWGFWLAYLTIPLTTIFFSTAYIPLVGNIFAENIRYIPMIIGNVVVFAFVVYLHFAFKYST